MSSTRVIDAQPERVETGPTRFGDDWTGVFIRGDDCVDLAVGIEEGNVAPVLALLWAAVTKP